MPIRAPRCGILNHLRG
ncbi:MULTISPECIES: Com family DNA-binding transcriptional regulator [unclassified Pedobacter]